MLGRLARFGPILSRVRLNPVSGARFVSQSTPPNRASVSDSQPALVHDGHGHAEVSEYEKNPDYHGFSEDPVEDKSFMQWAFFGMFSVCFVIGGTFIAYLPDHGMLKWARREAERLIKEREAAGLPLIDVNYYDPSTIVLPEDGKE